MATTAADAVIALNHVTCITWHLRCRWLDDMVCNQSSVKTTDNACSLAS